MEGESGVTRSVIDALYPPDIKGDQMRSESCVAQSMIDEL